MNQDCPAIKEEGGAYTGWEGGAYTGREGGAYTGREGRGLLQVEPSLTDYRLANVYSM